MFCPKCGSLMTPSSGKWVCRRCKNEISIDVSQSQTFETRSKTKELTIIEQPLDTLPKTTDTECPKCGHKEAYWVLRQTRAADEPETKIYQCTKCGHKWREY